MTITIIIIYLYLIGSYGVGMYIQVKHFNAVNKICIADLILFILSPINLIPIGIIHVISYIVDLDFVLFEKKK